MAGETACFIKSVVLQAGEPFVLPPGATLIGATDVDILDSVCADLEGLEALVCYTCGIPYKRTTADNVRFYENGSNEGIEINGYKLNGVDFNLSNVHNPDQTVDMFLESFDGNSVATDIANKIGASAFGHDHYENDEDLMLYIHVQTIPSIGDNLFLKTYVDSGELTSSSANVYYPFVLSSTISAGLPDLPCEPEV